MVKSEPPHLFEKIADYRSWRRQLACSTDKPLLGLIPTMGALHAGHGALIERARAECDYVAVSIFVNPLQFGANEDFGRYPRTFKNDLELCARLGVDAILHPDVSEIYPRQLERLTTVTPPTQLVQRLCGLFRPGHFEGVATIVAKLLCIVEPTAAYFGEKDFQQLTIVKQMVTDLNIPTTVVAVPTLRHEDGLALSSRNVYLTPNERLLAPVLHKVIARVSRETLAGSTSIEDAVKQSKAELEAVPGLSLQYLEVCHADTLLPLSTAARPMVVLIAAKLGGVRLIDNVVER